VAHPHAPVALEEATGVVLYRATSCQLPATS